MFSPPSGSTWPGCAQSRLLVVYSVTLRTVYIMGVNEFVLKRFIVNISDIIVYADYWTLFIRGLHKVSAFLFYFSFNLFSCTLKLRFNTISLPRLMESWNSVQEFYYFIFSQLTIIYQYLVFMSLSIMICVYRLICSEYSHKSNVRLSTISVYFSKYNTVTNINQVTVIFIYSRIIHVFILYKIVLLHVYVCKHLFIYLRNMKMYFT